MTKVVLQDAQIVAAFGALQQRAEVCDSEGHVLGYYTPRLPDPLDPERPRSFRGVMSPFSKEELDRRYREGAKDAKTLAEFWEEMRKKYPEKFQ